MIKMQDQRSSVVFCITDLAGAIDLIKNIVSEILCVKMRPSGRMRRKRKPTGDQNIVTTLFGLLIIFVGFVGDAISGRVYIVSCLRVKPNHDSSAAEM
jgi:hypothetical protein